MLKKQIFCKKKKNIYQHFYPSTNIYIKENNN